MVFGPFRLRVRNNELAAIKNEYETTNKVGLAFGSQSIPRTR